MKGRERAIVTQTNVGTVSKTTLGELLRDGVQGIVRGFDERIDTTFELNRTVALANYFTSAVC